MDRSPDRTGYADEHGSWRWWALVVVIVALGALIRETGLGFTLPTTVFVDERVYIEQIEAFESGAPNPAELPRAGFYPHLVARLAYATWRPQPCEALDVAGHLECASALHLHVRRIVAWMSLLAIPGTWLLVRAFASRATALIATAIAATSLLAQCYGQQGRPHAAFLGCLPLALALAVHLQRHPSVARALAAGGAAALALATLQSALFLLAPIAVAIALVRNIGWRRRLVLFACAMVPCVLAFAWAYPFLFVEQIDFDIQRGHGLLGEARWGLRLLSGRGFGVLADALWSYEPVGFVALLTGIALAAWAGLRSMRACKSARSAANMAEGARASSAQGVARRAWSPASWNDTARSAAVVAAFLVPYLLAFGLYKGTVPRYALPLVPFVAGWTAWMLTPRRARARAWTAWVPALVVVAVQAAFVAQFARVRAQPDTLAEAARWIERELPASVRLALFPGDDLPLLRRLGQRQVLAGKVFAPHEPWLAYQSRLGSGPWDAEARDVTVLSPRVELLDAELRTSGVEYVVLRTYGNPRRGDLERARDALARCGSLRATFRAIDDDDPRPFVPRDQLDQFPREAFWLGRLVRAERVGQIVEVWRIEPGR